MIQRITLIVLVALFAFSFAYAENTKQDKTAGATAAQNSTMTGVINKIDLNTKTITFRPDDSKQVQDISYSESTVFQKENGAVKPEDLKQGDRVAIEVDSTNTITRLQFQPAAPDQAQKQQ